MGNKIEIFNLQSARISIIGSKITSQTLKTRVKLYQNILIKLSQIKSKWLKRAKTSQMDQIESNETKRVKLSQTTKNESKESKRDKMSQTDQIKS